ncbi:hypothetical protein DVH26_23145 [Paenibacillus sp. H1-7]|uniref:pectinesterase family protein n=1 Tax=Paenibacillus sp. H1-7 TaxID=2282849 RepID=UPI001EF98443|nr:pectinesterase family protein [Paenibacillus sp. H1-7]ULL17083.1 hypothetical protein DVH26_23145 [Paenibacillus sp. H1-7]
MKKWLSQMLVAALLSSGCLPANAAAEPVQSQVPLAFPGAEGGGKFTTGGRGGEVYVVNTLADSGPGSLRDAVSGSNRMIIFKVGGNIHLQSPLKITGSNLTIAGQTAPGDGITISDYPMTFEASNLIIRYLRVRMGDKMPTEADAFGGRYQKNIIIDHCSFSWSVDEVMSNYGNENVTVQWSVISEAMHLSRHVKGKHGYGGIWGGKNTSYHHNLIAHNSSRNPAFDSTAGNYHDFQNNVVYNWGYFASYGGKEASTNLINNYYKPGPDTENIRFLNAETKGSYYISGNVMEGYPDLTADNWSGVYKYPDYKQLDTPVSFALNPLPSQSAQDAYTAVLEGAGAKLPKRDPVDARIINDVINGTGKHLNSQNEVGGYPEYETVVSNAVDDDGDGMPNNWELQHGLNPNEAADGRLVNSEGYTNLEIYLNSITTNGSHNPNVAITAPQNNAIVPTGSDVAVTTTVSDSDGTVEKVEFYSDGVKLGEDLSAPFTLDWNNVPDGTHYLIAKAIDNTGTATYSTNVTIHANQLGSIAPWTAADVGAPGIPGHTQLSGSDGSVITVKSAGDIEGTQDAFHFAYQQMSGNMEIVAQIDSITPTDEGAEAGLMFRESLDASSAFVSLVFPYMKTGKRGVTLSRTAKGAEISQIVPDSEFQLPYWAKLVRSGDQFTSFVSPDGVNWTLVGTTNVSLPNEIYAGLAADASKANNRVDKYNTSSFSNVTITALPTELPTAPVHVAATPGNEQITLTWDPAEYAKSYNVKRSQLPEGPFTQVAAGLTEPVFTQTGLTPGMTYYYVITSVNANGESIPSDVVSAVPTGTPGTVYHANDDFEESAIGSTPDGYAVTPNPQDADHTVTVQPVPEDSIGNSSSQALKVYDNAPGSTQIVRNFPKQTSTVIFETDYMSPSHPGTSIVLQVKDEKATKTPISIELRKPVLPVPEDKYMLTYKNKNSQDVKLMELANNRWYNIKIVANVAANKMDIYIDNVLAAKDIDLKDDMRTLGLGSSIIGRTPGTGKGTMYFDNFKIYVEPVASPQGLAAIPGNGKVQLDWTLTNGALSYSVKRSTTKGGPYEIVGPNVTATTFTDSTVSNNTTYYYVVIAHGESGDSGNSNEVTVTPSESAIKPEAPAALKTDARNTQADLSWQPVQNAAAYSIKRSDNAEGPFQVVKNNVMDPFFRDTGLDNGKMYYYVVSATNVAGESENSAVQSVRPVAPLQSPKGLTAIAGDTRSTISWNASEGAATYAVKRSTVNGGPYTVIAENLSGTQFEDKALANGTAYYYVVSAANGTTASANSDSIRVIPVPANTLKAPSDIRLLAGSQMVNIEWTAVPGASFYHVKRALSMNGPFTTIAAVNELAFRDTAVTNGTTYYYAISSVNDKTEGIASFPQEAVPAAVIVVDKNGGGAFTKVQDAVDSIPAGNTARTVIYIRSGTYEEQVTIPATKHAVSFIGEDKENTVITYTGITGTGFNERATAVESNDFIAENITFANGAGTAGVAVALDLRGDRAYLNNVRLIGFQDTLFTNATGKRLYVTDSYIEGAVDFIYGPSIAVFKNSTIHNVRSGGYVTAASTPENQKYGYLFINSKFTAEPGVNNMYLGRPWRPFAHTVFMNTDLGDIVHPAGWNNWGRVENEATARYYEYNNTGSSAEPKGRAPWSKQLKPEEANEYTVQLMMAGSDGWDPTLIASRNHMDITAPTTKDDAPENWSNKDVTVTLTASDSGSGIASTYYSIDGGAQQEGSSVTVTTEGVHTLTYWSVDKAGNVEAKRTAAVRIDKTAPSLKVTLDKKVLWPANHKMVTVTASVYAEDALSHLDSVVLTSITSNENDNDAGKDQQPDIQEASYGTYDTTFMLRAEREGKGSGRVYTITYTAADQAGNINTVSETVTVPHDSGNP